MDRTAFIWLKIRERGVHFMYDGIIWSQIVAVTVVMLIAATVLYRRYFRTATAFGTTLETTKNEWFGLGVLLIAGLIVRMLMAYSFHGFILDMNLFKAWGKQMLEDGISSAYNSDTFVDYPPGYLCVLGILQWIVEFFGLGDMTDNTQGLVNMIYKIPACLCDLGVGYFVYKTARDRLPKNMSLLLAAAYIFNPSVLINSAAWGQVDGVYALTVVAMIYFITKEKLPAAYFICIAGVLIKPQMMFFAPILIWAIFEQVLLTDFNWKKFFVNLFSGLAAVLCAFLFMIPFGVGRVIKQYTETLTSYPYATVNAFNLWGALGMDWEPQEEKFLGIPATTWGTFFLIVSVLFAILICYQMRKEKSKYFFAAGCLMTMIYTLSVRMHERYLFPAMALLLIAYCMKPLKQLFFAYAGISMVHFLNVGFVYMINPNNEGYTGPKQPEIVWISMLMVLMFTYVVYIAVKWYLTGKEENEQLLREQIEKEIRVKPSGRYFEGITPSGVLGKMTKTDFLVMFAITCIYSAFAFYNLGAHEGETPNTEYLAEWYSDGQQTVYPSITLDLGDSPDVTKVAYYLGNYEKRSFTVETADSLDGPWTFYEDMTMDSVFCWGEYEITTNERYLRLTSSNNAISIFEMVILNSDGYMLTPLNADEYPNLFDENMTYQECTARNSTYFDEIYHARTAYEYIQGRYSYENTHPPLGKCFIALGMLIWGVCPFGWRVMGVLFGIAMLPCIYLFVKRMFKETWLAACVTTLFAFDFMHFAQTRIATIDVFVTFFIILMYYFMYQYVSKSFYDTPLKKTFIPLGLSGICMGFGVASKWTGAYAGVGLAVIFFASLYRRYREYVYAKADESGETNGILHKDVVAKFKPYAWTTILFCIVFFVLIPAVIYTLSYIPFRDGSDDGLIAQMLKNQETMFSYHSELVSTHPYSCTWYNWPTMYRPIWYYSRHVTDTVSEGISAFGNPLVWWVGIPAVIYMVYLIWKDRDRKAAFFVISYLAQYLPWCLITRTTYMYHYFPSVPFITMMIGYAMYKLVDGKAKRRRIAYFYVAAAVGLFLFFYPVISGYPIEKQWVFDNLQWFDTWVLVT